ncbi:hypothetical protein MY494_00835 [Synechococcus sp. A10-1-5-1]|nr:hypothetical protein [Synechococcus sp. A10-1-5-1]UPM50383.1 hypothetical protein MY494_00835 [Synechococcus sp. A10-1-5-1]
MASPIGRFALRLLRVTASTASIIELLRSDWAGGVSAGLAWFLFVQLERRLQAGSTDTSDEPRS